MVETVAARLANTSRARMVGAELDDLVQEGLLNIWQTLERGVHPRADIVELRMRNWIELLARQTGHNIPSCTIDPATGEPRTHDENGEPLLDPCPQHITYDQMLPLDDFRVVPEA